MSATPRSDRPPPAPRSPAPAACAHAAHDALVRKRPRTARPPADSSPVALADAATRAAAFPAPPPMSADSAPSDVRSPDPVIERFSSFRLRDSESAQHTLEAHMRQRTFIPFARLKPGFKEPDISNEWTTIGVLLEKPVVRTSVNNKKYLFFKLGDLCDTTANVFIFGSFFDQFSHEAVGSVFALTCPKILPALEKSSLIGLEIEASCKILKLGVCLDCGVCKASSCKKAIDIRKGRLCTLHTELMIRKYQNAHSAFSSATSSLILGSPTKRTSLSTVGACHETYVWNDGIMISTVGENKMRFRTGKAGAQLVTPLSKQEKRLLQENTKGAKYVRTLRGIEQDKKDVSRVFNDDALAKLGFDPTTGKDTFTGSFKKMKLDPEKLRTNLDFGKIKECLVLGMDIPKEVFGAEEIEIEI